MKSPSNGMNWILKSPLSLSHPYLYVPRMLWTVHGILFLVCLFAKCNENYRTLDTFQIPFEMGDDLAVLICNSNVRHELSHSEYPTRRNQCAQALELMRLNSYKDATIKSLDGKYRLYKQNIKVVCVFVCVPPLFNASYVFVPTVCSKPVKTFQSKTKP